MSDVKPDQRDQSGQQHGDGDNVQTGQGGDVVQPGGQKVEVKPPAEPEQPGKSAAERRDVK